MGIARRFCTERVSQVLGNAISCVRGWEWEGCADGKVRVLVSSTEFGQGTKTVLCQIAAETLNLPYENVDIAQADTNVVPNSGPRWRREP